jgi:hypothetical protein
MLSRIQVRCHSGYKYDQEPREALWSGRWLRVTDVCRRWLWPGRSGFEVLLEDGTRMELVYDQASDVWLGRQLGQRRQAREGA